MQKQTSNTAALRRVETARSLSAAGGKIGRKIGVDREKEIIYGAVMAQAGPFKSEGRGSFDNKSLDAILKLAKAAPNGLKALLAHADFLNDGIGKLLGRWKNPFMDSVGPRESQGSMKTDTMACVRADLHIDPAAHKGPFDLADWLLTVAKSDPEAISASLVLSPQFEYQFDKFGRPLLDADGNQVPPIWRPVALHGCDIVDTGDAVDGLLAKKLRLCKQITRAGLTPAFAPKPDDWQQREEWQDRADYLNAEYKSGPGSDGPHGVYSYTLNGEQPPAPIVDRIRAALRNVPQRFIRKWLAAGGRMEVIPGDDARLHPAAPRGRLNHCNGWCLGMKCVVAGGSPDVSRTALHELGHAVFRQYVESSPEKTHAWCWIWRNDVSDGLSIRSQSRFDESEYFADCFAAQWSGGGGRLSIKACAFTYSLGA